MTAQQTLNAVTKQGRLGTYGTWALILIGAGTLCYLTIRAMMAPKATV